VDPTAVDRDERDLEFDAGAGSADSLADHWDAGRAGLGAEAFFHGFAMR